MTVTYICCGKSALQRRNTRGARHENALLKVVKTKAYCPVCGEAMTVRVKVFALRTPVGASAHGLYIASCRSKDCRHQHVDATKLVRFNDEALSQERESRLVDAVVAQAVSAAEFPRWELPRTAAREGVA